MFDDFINGIIKEVNSVVKYALKDKIFLLCSLTAVIVLLLGLLCWLNKLEWAIVLLTISISMSKALSYAYARSNDQVEKKLVTGTELMLCTVIAVIIGVLVFYDKTIQNPLYIYNRIYGKEGIVYVVCIIVPILIAIFSKIIINSGEPLYGGIVSVHSAFTISLFFINSHNATTFFLLIIPAISILLPRCISTNTWLKTSLKISGTLSMATLCILTILSKRNIVLILANFLMLLLVVLCQGKPVHKKMEIFFGILVGAICSTIILSIFL
ncbi:MAG TPA: hypothetical protein PLD95_02895 [bacterium]|nr:hypothetical protein [bacterium]HOG38397.1 hypothetical protein [bacterium]HQI03355.1 hypothetical protein [bacterium]